MSMMPPYPIYCYTRNCGRLAEFKIAARWSDGVTGELKTYGLVCSQCLADWYHRSCHKQSICRRAPGEILEMPGIYGMMHGQRDRELVRRTDLEKKLLAEASTTGEAKKD